MKIWSALQYSNTSCLTSINVMKKGKKCAKKGNFNPYRNQWN